MIVKFAVSKDAGNRNCQVKVTATWTEDEIALAPDGVNMLPPDEVAVCQRESAWAPRFDSRWLPCERLAYLGASTTEEEAVSFAARWARAVKSACEAELARVRTFSAISRTGEV